MEKSMVQELSSLTYSTIFTNRPSFISTHITDGDNNQLRKSRISNLPGYRKQDLSTKLNFVVVFQSIEIERLSREIEVLRVKARDWERQKHNYESYEVQIRQLTERCHMYELQKEGMNEQSQKMKIFCQQLYRQFEQYKAKYGQVDAGLKEKYALERRRSEQMQGEVDKWKLRCTSLERSKGKELEDMRLHFEAQRKSYINRQIKEITIKFQNELQNLSQELRKAREQIQWKNSEFQRLEHTLHGYEMRQQEIQQIESKMEDYENKFVMASQENYRLNELLRWKAEELQKIKITEQQLRQQIENFRNMEQSNNSLHIEISRLTQELQQHRVSYSRVSQRLQQLELENQKLNDYEKLVDQSANEIERLNGIVHSKIKQIDSFKNTNAILESKLSKVSSASQQEVSSYRERISSSEKEIERLTGQLKTRLGDHEALKSKNVELQKRLSRALLIEQQNKDLKGEVNQSTRKLQQLKMKITMLEENVSIVQQLKNTLREDQKFKNDMISERDRLNQTIRSLTLQLETSNQKLLSLQGQCNKYSNIQVELRQYQEKWAFMTQQLDRINAQIQLRVGELYQLRESLKSLSNSKNVYQNIEQRLVENMSQMETLILDLDNSRRQNERLQNTNMSLQMSVKKMQGDMIGINQQRTQLSQMLQDKTGQVQRMSQQIEQWASIVSQHRIYQQQNQQYQKKVESLQNSYSQLEGRYHKEIKRSEEYSNQVEQMCSQLMQLRQQPTVSGKVVEEISILRQQTEEKSLAINYLTQRILHIENILKNIKQKYAMQCQAAHEMGRKAESVYSKMGTLDQVVEMALRYNEEINKVKEQNIMLESQSRLMDIELCESVKVLEEGQGAPYQQPMLTTFGLGQGQTQYKNESLAGKVSATFESRDGNIFTFKDMANNHSQQYQQEQTQQRNNYQQMPSDRVIYQQQTQQQVVYQQPEVSYHQQYIQQLQQQEPEIVYHQPQQVERAYYQRHEYQHYNPNQFNDNNLNDQSSSMASSFIHNLTGRQTSGRYQNVGVSQQFQSINNPNFGKGVTVSKMRYLPSSPSNRPSTSHVVSSSNRTPQDIQFVSIQTDNRPPSAYVSNFQELPPRQSQSVILQNQGVKRVTSYTHFSGHGQPYPSQISPKSYQQQGLPQGFQVSQQSQDVPRIRVLEAAQSHNIASSTNGTSVLLPKRTRLGNDPSPSYVQ